MGPDCIVVIMAPLVTVSNLPGISHERLIRTVPISMIWVLWGGGGGARQLDFGCVGGRRYGIVPRPV